MKYISLIIIFSLVFSCNISKNVTGKKTSLAVPSAAVYVYKTKGDYFNNVPVTLSADKSKIVSYPHPSDIKTDGNYSKPTKLKKAYLLDNRGINQNSAFLKLTYEEYANITTVPSLAKLKSWIIDDDPFVELYYCGLKTDFEDIEKQLNEAIKKDKLHEYKRMK